MNDLRAVEREYLVHVIARVVTSRAQSANRPVSAMEAHDLAEQVAAQMERIGWQVLRHHEQALRERR